MCTHNKWQSITNFKLNYDSIGTLSVPILLMQKSNRNDRLNIFYNILNIYNYSYNEIILKFVELLNIVVNKCLNFFEANLMENFFNCSFLLEKAVKNSLKMFESLYNAINFLSYIDLNLRNYKLVFIKFEANTFNAVDDIYKIKNHKYLKIKRNECLYGNIQEFLDVKEFIDDVYNIANNFFEKNKSIVDNVEKINFKAIYEMEYSSHNKDFPCFVSFMYRKINSFYTETIKNNYEDLGFIQLINPTIPKLKPPKDDIINQEMGISILNTLFSEGSWSSFSHIEIQYDDFKISAERVIRDLVTDHNFHLKKHYFTRIVRCRFLEVLVNYNSSLSALKIMCKNEKYQVNSFDYVKCVTCLFDAINDTAKIFDFMLTIIEKIKLSAIWQPIKEVKSYSDLLSTYNLIYNYVVDLKTKNVLRYMFVNNPKVNTEKLADDYIKNFEKTRYKFTKTIITSKHSEKNRCFLDGLLLTKEEMLIKFKNNANIIISKSNESRVTNYELISKYLNDFCGNFINTDYVDTGFYNIHPNYFWLWT
ncbi:uncharacterized protein LOC126907784 [Daktulosphaira vitifoliae]|uniref:uncharacterized protein LOC126907784 n=1 Tax=Daktulosphaira vitifoliae TaxID=58002 RepID=UPI0021AA58BA|nr:uncharacterized protein LOC126907784 [Daktulosphaira vitifoliae]